MEQLAWWTWMSVSYDQTIWIDETQSTRIRKRLLAFEVHITTPVASLQPNNVSIQLLLCLMKAICMRLLLWVGKKFCNTYESIKIVVNIVLSSAVPQHSIDCLLIDLAVQQYSHGLSMLFVILVCLLFVLLYYQYQNRNRNHKMSTVWVPCL